MQHSTPAICLAFTLLTASACTNTTPADPADMEVVPLYLGSTDRSLREFENRYRNAEPGETFHDLWGSASPIASCDPQSAYMMVFVIRVPGQGTFDATFGIKYVRDRDRHRRSFNPLYFGPTQQRITNGISQPIYVAIAKEDRKLMSGRLVITRRDVVLHEQMVRFECELPVNGAR